MQKMADKTNTKQMSSSTMTATATTTMWSNNNKPVKMKLFGAWEIDKTPSDCIPRLCSLNITRLTLNKSLWTDATAIMVAVKMQNSKRILRSNEITIPSSTTNQSNDQQQQNQMLDIELDLSFTLQYPHFIKRTRNYLQIILQRRKKYKNKAILGYKTLACGLIDMVEVLQRSTINEKTLDLIGRVKDIGKNEIIARIMISSLKSQPIDNQDNSSGNLRRGKVSIDRPDVYSDDDDFTSAEDGSDSETIEEGNNVMFRRKLNHDHKSRKLFTTNDKFRSIVPTNVQQRNLKQKFISLLKKFRLPDSEAYDSEEKFQEALEKELMSSTQEPPEDIDEFFDDEEIDDLDYMTDSGQEFDDVSISSTPKPSLRPFFSSCTLVGQDKSYEFPIAEHNNNNSTNKLDESQETSGTDGTPETSDNSQKQMNLDLVDTLIVPSAHNKKKLSFDKETKRVKLFPRDKDNKNHHHNHREKEKKSLHATMSLLSTTTNYHHHKDDTAATNTSKEFVLNQLNKVFVEEPTATIPEEIIFINLTECMHNNQQEQQSFIQMFERTNYRIITTNTLNDIRLSFNFLCNRIQKYCNNNNNLKISTPIKLILIGSDPYINSFLRYYVESLANKSQEWQNFFRFFIIPINYLYHHGYHHPHHHYGSNMLHKYIASIDQTYSQYFFPSTTTTKSLTTKDYDSSRFINNTTITTTTIAENNQSSIDNNNNLQGIHEFYQKIVNFINNAQTVIQIPIAEAMVTYKDKNFDDESNQVFIPFICDVKIGLADHAGSHSMEEELFNFSTVGINLSSNSMLQQQSQPQVSTTQAMMIDKSIITSPTFNSKDQQQQQQHISTPPNSPSMTATTTANNQHVFNQLMNKESMMMNEVMDLQFDYWTASLQPRIVDISSSSAMASSSSSSSSSSNKKSDNCKFTLKNSFRHVQITRLPNFGEATCSSLTFSYITKEKKQKIMRLGKKKEKDVDGNKCPRQTIEGICRLVCSYKTSQSPIKLIIDGVEYSGVKFFQLTPQWQTQVKFFPIVIYSNNPPPLSSSLTTTTTTTSMIDKDIASSSSSSNHVMHQQQQHNNSQNDNYHHHRVLHH